VQPNTNILVWGESDNRILLMRFTSAGILDGTFGAGGIVTLILGNKSLAKGLVNQFDGKTLITGFSDGNLYISNTDRY